MADQPDKTVGHNSVAGEQLRSFVERIERVEGEIDDLRDDVKSIYAEAKSNGYVPAGIRHIVKLRKMKPDDRAEAEVIRDTYMHALGMLQEPPLFRWAGVGGIDNAVREQVIEAMHPFVPAFGKGDIVVNMDGKKLRLERKKDGHIDVSEVNEQALRPQERKDRVPRENKQRDVPDVDDEGAIELGREACRNNEPIIKNPFPYSDDRRKLFDKGWREAAGEDGMGAGDLPDLEDVDADDEDGDEDGEE